jgi:LPXTG-motif cell wall-anchored protein
VTPLVAAAAVVGLVLAPSAYSSCVKMTPKEQSELAEVVFEGVALTGPAVDGVLVTPAHFRITRYLKGDGPDVRLVATALRRSAHGSIGHLSVGILPGAGQHWRIFGANTRGGVLGTSICSGSGPIGSTSAAPFVGGEDADDLYGYSALGGMVVLLVAAGLLLLRRRRRAHQA